jgi:hypothetical protein
VSCETRRHLIAREPDRPDRLAAGWTPIHEYCREAAEPTFEGFRAWLQPWHPAPYVFDLERWKAHTEGKR